MSCFTNYKIYFYTKEKSKILITIYHNLKILNIFNISNVYIKQ